MIKIKRAAVWLPDYLVDSVLQIDADELKQSGITHVVFDLDNTLLTRRTDELSAETIMHINELRKSGLKIILGSNTRRNTDTIIIAIKAESVRATGLAMKPFKSYYEKIIALAGTSAEKIAMAGDHVINDVVGANRAGLQTILVKSLSRRPLTINQAYIGWLKKYNQAS